ncbi:DUF7344 domain-containing protein [Natronorubrum daqingense]|uniref:DUF7344 domain-containing protein n=1 Tax=Natronorubrum daqingense TaxID=588898 RepID=A0A1N6YYA1_9EURY|nr:hypothetical protein [Natronorubrum daqingense]APX95527.1 hypothetical protein BB347_02245 [Natronorubrum daqingense]SIR19469.1 hypothetical protein SAMN05421809_0600 [Natronorubrum daqingense]
MSSCQSTPWTTTAFDILADANRRYLLSTLYKRTESLPLEAAATEVAVQKHDSPVVTDEQARTAHIELVHCHVPRLVEAGLVRELTEGGTEQLALADHPILDIEWVTRLLEKPTGGSTADEELVDRTLDVVQSEQRRRVCQFLAKQDQRVPVADLAVTLVARTQETRLVDVERDDWQPMETALVHNHLPALADVGLVNFDRSSETVALATDAPQWRSEWLATSPLGTVTETLEPTRKPFADDADEATQPGASASATAKCWTIDGREPVLERSDELADSADDELFVSIPDPSMLQQECLDHWQDAAERGVDIYVGSRSRDVRDIVRSVIPQATVCEPQFDWLNFPVDGIHHGCVVLADREQVMLVTVDDEADRTATMSAVTGEGPDNALGRLVRNHVGPRLDRLESRSVEDWEGQTTPFPM